MKKKIRQLYEYYWPQQVKISTWALIGIVLFAFTVPIIFGLQIQYEYREKLQAMQCRIDQVEIVAKEQDRKCREGFAEGMTSGLILRMILSDKDRAAIINSIKGGD
jgi:hypothetical protein